MFVSARDVMWNIVWSGTFFVGTARHGAVSPRMSHHVICGLLPHSRKNNLVGLNRRGCFLSSFIALDPRHRSYGVSSLLIPSHTALELDGYVSGSYVNI